MGEWANTFSTYYATQLIVPIALGVLALLLRAPQAAEVETAGLGARLDETEGQGAAQTVTAQPGPAQAAQIPAEDTSTVRSSFDPRSLIPCGALLAAVCLIAVGISRGEMQVVLAKAINICMQCIGIG
ncbi:MAG: CD1871A family CXXC motif-containing protein [Eubacteriales bacterium]|nr:CD1871A family CXXC motif-containing protein [Eubacteriales bacterium]